MPNGLTIARIIMAVQAVTSLGVWVGQLLTTLSHIDHNQDVVGAAVLVDVINPLIAVGIGVAAIFIASRPRWARPLAVGLEVVGVIGALITLSTGFPQAIVAIVLAIAVLVLIVRAPATV